MSKVLSMLVVGLLTTVLGVASAFAAGPYTYNQPVCVVSYEHLGNGNYLNVTNDTVETCSGWLLMTRQDYTRSYSGDVLTMEDVAEIVQAIMLLLAVAWGVKQLVKFTRGSR